MSARLCQVPPNQRATSTFCALVRPVFVAWPGEVRSADAGPAAAPASSAAVAAAKTARLFAMMRIAVPPERKQCGWGTSAFDAAHGDTASEVALERDEDQDHGDDHCDRTGHQH